MSSDQAYEIEVLRKSLGELQGVNEMLRHDVLKANNRMQTATAETESVRREVDRLRDGLRNLLDFNTLPDADALPPTVVSGTAKDAVAFYRGHLARCRNNLRQSVGAILNPG